MAAKWRLGLAGGVAIVNPIPVEDEIPADEIGEIIEQALADVEANRFHGKEAHPVPARADRRDHQRSQPRRQSRW